MQRRQNISEVRQHHGMHLDTVEDAERAKVGEASDLRSARGARAPVSPWQQQARPIVAVLPRYEQIRAVRCAAPCASVTVPSPVRDAGLREPLPGRQAVRRAQERHRLTRQEHCPRAPETSAQRPSKQGRDQRQ